MVIMAALPGIIDAYWESIHACVLLDYHKQNQQLSLWCEANIWWCFRSKQICLSCPRASFYPSISNKLWPITGKWMRKIQWWVNMVGLLYQGYLSNFTLWHMLNNSGNIAPLDVIECKCLGTDWKNANGMRCILLYICGIPHQKSRTGFVDVML